MTGLPTVQVLLDDGTGTFPLDVTAFTSLSEGVGVSGFGRADEFDQPNAASLTLTLDNADGVFTSGTGFGAGGFGAGPFGGVYPLIPGQRVRYVETLGSTTSARFTGRIVAVDLGWPGGGETFAQVRVTAVDLLADVSRRILRSMVEEEVLLDSPAAYYTLGEPEGATAAGDTSGNGTPPLVSAGTGTPLTFGSGTGPTDGLTTASFLGGTFLRGTGTTWVPTGSPFTLECYFATSLTPTAPALILNLDDGGRFVNPTAYLGLMPTGKLTCVMQGTSLLTSGAVNDGLVHHAAMTLTAGGVMTLYLDGVSVGTVGSVPLPGGPAVRLGVAPNDTPIISAPFVGTVAHAAVYTTALSAARITAHATAANDNGETTGARLSRLAAYAGMSATTVTPSGQTIGIQDTTGQSAFDAMQTVATAEGGVLFANGTGGLVMQGRYYRGLRTTPDATFIGLDASSDTQVTWDNQQLINQVTVTGSDGVTQTVQDAGSVAANGVYPKSLDIPVGSDTTLGFAQWTLTKHSTTTPRLGSVTFDLLTSPSAEQILGLEIGDRINLTSMPGQLWAAGDYVIEGWDESLSGAAWTLTANVLPWELNQVWVLGDPTDSILGTSTVLGY